MIKGITPTFAEAGKIKIGGLGEERKKRDGPGTYRLPVKLDHFRVTKTTRGQDGQFELDEELMDRLPLDPDGKVREIPIVVHSDEIDQVFTTRYAKYVGRALACSGDGETATLYQIRDGKRTGEIETKACVCSDLAAGRCKPNGILHCGIVAPGRALAGAVHKWRTTSIVSVQQMYGSLLQIKELCGGLRGALLVLRVKPVQVQPAGVITTVYCCHVELREQDLTALQNRLVEARRMRAVVAGEVPYADVVQLPAAPDEPTEEQAEVGAEFYPEEPTQPEAPAKGAALLDTLRNGGVAREPEPVVEPDPEPEPEPDDETSAQCMELFERWRDDAEGRTRANLMASALGPDAKRGLVPTRAHRIQLIHYLERSLGQLESAGVISGVAEPVGKAGF